LYFETSICLLFSEMVRIQDDAAKEALRTFMPFSLRKLGEGMC